MDKVPPLPLTATTPTTTPKRRFPAIPFKPKISRPPPPPDAASPTHEPKRRKLPTQTPRPSPTSAQLHQTLSQHFGHSKFRGFQETVVTEIASGRDTLVIMPTGGGKSLCYQLPAMALDGVAVVVSPLIALMQDQVEALKRRGIPAASLHSSLPAKTRAELIAQLISLSQQPPQQQPQQQQQQQQQLVQQTMSRAGTLSHAPPPPASAKPPKIIYTTPETLTSNRFREIFQSLAKANLLSLVAVDEAHCISEWGHEFRPCYRQIGCIRSWLPDYVPIVAATATANLNVKNDIVARLKLRDPGIHIASFDRPNIYYDVVYKNFIPSVFQHLLSYLQSMGVKSRLEQQQQQQQQPYDPQDMQEQAQQQTQQQQKQQQSQPQQVHSQNSGGGNSSACGIIYCQKRDSCDELAGQLNVHGYQARSYHAKLSDKEREDVLNKFILGEIAIVVATVAFGMGIDKHDVRFVVHMEIPANMESFYQQSGRAGRDGGPSRSLVYYSRDDSELREFLAKQTLARQMQSVMPKQSERSCPVESFDKLKRVFESFSCRRRTILEFFGETKAQKPTKEAAATSSTQTSSATPSFPCCDVCDDTANARKRFDTFMSKMERTEVYFDRKAPKTKCSQSSEDDIEDWDNPMGFSRQAASDDDDGTGDHDHDDHDDDKGSPENVWKQAAMAPGMGFKSAREALLTPEPTGAEAVARLVVDRGNLQQVKALGGMHRSKAILTMIEALANPLLEQATSELKRLRNDEPSFESDEDLFPVLCALARVEHVQCFTTSTTQQQYDSNVSTLVKSKLHSVGTRKDLARLGTRATANSTTTTTTPPGGRKDAKQQTLLACVQRTITSTKAIAKPSSSPNADNTNDSNTRKKHTPKDILAELGL